MTSRLAIIVPSYNEEEILNNTISVLSQVISKLKKQHKVTDDSFILFVDDGSKDHTWTIINENSQSNPLVKGLKLSRNFGHQYALWAGLMEVRLKVDITISIDADLQDDPNIIFSMINEYQKGNQIVYGIRNDRSTDTFFKKGTANLFYKFMNLIGVHIIPNHADFRLMSRKALDLLSQYHERQLFIRGLIPQLGLQTSKVYYKRRKRLKGKSKYTLRKMLNLAWNGITLFSTSLLKVPTILGIIFLLYGIFIGVMRIFNIHNFNVNLISLWIIGGSILLSLGIISEYLSKTFNEEKKRPRYLIEKRTYKNK